MDVDFGQPRSYVYLNYACLYIQMYPVLSCLTIVKLFIAVCKGSFVIGARRKAKRWLKLSCECIERYAEALMDIMRKIKRREAPLASN